MGVASPGVHTRRDPDAPGPWWATEVFMPRLLFGGAGGFLACMALSAAASSCLCGEVTWDAGALLADAALLSAALSMAFLRSHPRAHRLVLAASAAVLAVALLVPSLRSPGFTGATGQYVAVTALCAAFFALGALSVVRCARPSPELCATLLWAVFALLALLCVGFSSDALETTVGGAIAAVAVAALLVWRATVLTRRNAW